MQTINSFSGEYRWLSNFYLAAIDYQNLTFPSSEHLYQAAKCKNMDDVYQFTKNITPGQAKRIGSKVLLKDNWNESRINIMKEITAMKYDQNPDLKEKLIRTKGIILIEGNTWGDTFWGVCQGTGHNHLGRALMEYRDSI